MEILGRATLRKILTEKPNFYNVILIASSDWEIFDLEPLCKDYLTVYFSDVITSEREDAPQLEQVKEAIEWGLDKDNLLISCAAGISRSPAIAYLINSQLFDDGLSAIDVNKHRPNQLILHYGNQILGKNVASKVYDHFKQEFENNPTGPNASSLRIYLHDYEVLQKKMTKIL